jgi:8-oxo-dGTP diphosphatase
VTADVRAAGALLWRRAGDEVEIAVARRPRYDDWTLPKGKALPGEPLPVCAVREVREETGFAGALGRFLGRTEYTTDVGGDARTKVVSYWAQQASDGEFAVNDEVTELRWLRPDEARAQLTYPRDRGVVDAFTALPTATATVLLVRHASAGSPEQWRGDDRDRPLDARGLREAAAVAEVLPAFGVRRVVSADVLRCEQTVQPLAGALGLGVDLEPLFSEEGYWRDGETAYARLVGLARADEPVVVCSQGGMIPDVVGRLLREHGVEHADAGASGKGSVWALSFAEGRLVDADYLAQPLA